MPSNNSSPRYLPVLVVSLSLSSFKNMLRCITWSRHMVAAFSVFLVMSFHNKSLLAFKLETGCGRSNSFTLRRKSDILQQITV